MFLRTTCCTPLLFALLAGTAGAETFTYTVRSGKPALFHSFYSYGPDCSQGTNPRISVRSKPGNGKAIIRPVRITPKKGEVCAGAKLGAMAVGYQSRPGFRGTDRFTTMTRTPLFEGSPRMRANASTYIITVK